MTAAVMFPYVTEDMVGHKLGEFYHPYLPRPRRQQDR